MTIATDDPDEIYDLVDETDRVIGTTTRRVCRCDPDKIHREVFLLVFDKDDRILMQKRSAIKSSHPGKWTLSVTGHVDQGESYEQAMGREMLEEIGVELSFIFISKILIHFDQQAAWVSIYRAEHKDGYQPNAEEVSELRFFTLSEIRTKIWQQITPASQRAIDHLIAINYLK